MVPEDSKKGLRDINGRTFADWEKDRTCSKCQNNSVYYYRVYDALFCASCNEWHDGTCNDPSCDYCPNRPLKPLLEP